MRSVLATELMPRWLEEEKHARRDRPGPWELNSLPQPARLKMASETWQSLNSEALTLILVAMGVGRAGRSAAHARMLGAWGP